MHQKFLTHSPLRLFLILMLLAVTLSTPGQSVSAQPLSDAFTDCENVTGILIADCTALEGFYDGTGAGKWTVHTGWLTTSTPCSWYGVTCTDKRVTGLILNNNGLTGSIPAELSSLTKLTILDLSDNLLKGSIPASLGSLAYLTDLNLNFNMLSGAIPPQLGNLTSLRSLYLYSNELSGAIPPELGNLTSLTDLGLGDNQLSGSIPAALGSLTNLRYMYLYSNQLSGSIPSSLGSLTNLTRMYLNSNQLTGAIPTELGSLTHLTYLDLSSNLLSGEFPVTITNLVQLTVFKFDFCKGLVSTNAVVKAFLDEKASGWNICSISGNAGIGGAKLKYTDGSPRTVTADANGDYSFNVSYNWSGTVTPSRVGFTFSPASISYTNVLEDRTTQNYKAILGISSTAARDGWVLESNENSNVGGSLNATTDTLRLGDDKRNKQYRSILSFNTSGLPDNAVITNVTLKVKFHSITGGGDPLTTFQGFMVDIKKGIFGTSALQIADFQTAATRSRGPFTPALAGDWYIMDLTGGKAGINKLATNSGLTQIRLAFNLDDDDNALANYLSLFSGNAPAASRPKLIIQFHLP